MAPAARPSTIAAQGSMNAQAGVMATSPATAPEATPRVVGLPLRYRSTRIQPPGAEQHQREVVRPHRVLAPAPALAEHDREREARGAGVDVNDRAAGEVLDPQAAEPAAAPYPVGDREVHQRC